MKKLKVGFLIDNFYVSHEVFDLVNFVNSNNLFCEPVIIHGYKDFKKETLYKKVLKKIKNNGVLNFLNFVIFFLIIKVLDKIEAKHAKKQFPNFEKNFDIRKIPNCKFIKTKGLWSKSKINLNFSDEDISILENQKFDCLIRCGSGILKGKILTVSKFGILSFHHGDNRVNRGGPAGFWEVYKKIDSTGFIIQVLNEELDGGKVLMRGNIMTLNTWAKNRANIFEKSNFFMKKILSEIAISEKLPKFENQVTYNKPFYKLNKASTLIGYIVTVLVPIFINKLINFFKGIKVVRWQVAYSSNDNFGKLLSFYKEIKNPKGRFFADPFVFEYSNRQFIFVEDFYYNDNKGRISAIEIKNNKEKIYDNVLEEDFHLSFPYIFESEGSIYMIPETHSINQIRLYKCIAFPCKWKLEKILMEGINSPVDTIVIKKLNHWFLLTTICSSGLGDTMSELHVFYSDKLCTKDWKPIKSGNPVIFDSLKARNGGMFYFNGTLYRVNQSQGKFLYGKSFGINKVKTLDMHNYEEENVNNIFPTFKEGIVTTHHFNSNAKLSVVDYGRFERIKNIINEK